MAIERYIGALHAIPVQSRINTHVRIQDTVIEYVGFDVSGLIDGNTDVIVYFNGLSIEARLTKTQARRLAELLTQAADI